MDDQKKLGVVPINPDLADVATDSAKDDPELLYVDSLMNDMPDLHEDSFEVDMDKANSILYVIGKIQGEMDEVKAVAQKQIEKAKMFQDAECNKMQRTIDFLTARVHGFAIASGKRTVNLPNGKLKLIKKQDKFEITDQDAVLSWIRENKLEDTLIRIKEDVNKTEVKKYFKTTGEIPDGLEVTPQDDSFKAVPE